MLGQIAISEPLKTPAALCGIHASFHQFQCGRRPNYGCSSDPARPGHAVLELSQVIIIKALKPSASKYSLSSRFGRLPCTNHHRRLV